MTAMTTPHFTRLSTLRNVAYSFAWAFVVWLFFWFFWFTALPRIALAPRIEPPVIRYISGATPAVGISWASASIVIPARSKLMQREEQLHATGPTTNTVLKPEYLADMPGDFPSRQPDGAGEWAASKAVATDRDIPQYVDLPVFQTPAETAAGWSLEILDGSPEAELAWSEAYKDDPPVVARALAVIAWIQTGARGEVQHVFLEQPSGNAVVDRAALKRLYAAQIRGTNLKSEWRIRLTLSGKP